MDKSSLQNMSKRKSLRETEFLRETRFLYLAQGGNSMLTTKKFISLFTALMLLSSVVVIAMASTTAEQTVQIAVQEINEVEIYGAINFTISQINTDIIDSSTTITYETNSTTSKKITAALNDVLPTGVTLKIEIEDGAGQKILSNDAVDVVTGLTQIKDTKIITIQFALAHRLKNKLLIVQ